MILLARDIKAEEQKNFRWVKIGFSYRFKTQRDNNDDNVFLFIFPVINNNLTLSIFVCFLFKYVLVELHK